jgi:pimeloyl-ACP methyl ester carboxylesterase
VLASPGLGGYVAVERPSFLQPMMAALGAKDFAGAAAALARTPVMQVGSSDSVWVARMVQDQASVFQQDPTRERALVPAAIRRLREIGVPVLVVTGSDDMRDIVLTGDTLVSAIPNSRRIRVQGAKHLLNITHASQFNTVLTEFLKHSMEQ